jgi:hypothetical protein
VNELQAQMSLVVAGCRWTLRACPMLHQGFRLMPRVHNIDRPSPISTVNTVSLLSASDQCANLV